MIDAVILDVGLEDKYTKPMPTKVSLKIDAFKTSPFDMNFNYHSLIGKLNYMAQTTRPDIIYITHQIAKYFSDPCKEHGETIIYLVKSLQHTHDLVLLTFVQVKVQERILLLL